MSTSSRLLIHGGRVCDATGVNIAPGALLVHDSRVLAAGTPQEIGHVVDAELVSRPDALILPALVNAHSHLDLTHLGPRPLEGSFVDWIRMVRRARHSEASDTRTSVETGIALSLDGGTGLIGDIAGAFSLEPFETQCAMQFRGVSFVELFGLGDRQRQAISVIERIERHRSVGTSPTVRLGIQPHAPYSCGAEIYERAARCGLPFATHLAETPEENSHSRSFDGPLRAMLEDFDAWQPGLEPVGKHPVEHVLDLIGMAPMIAAHLNYVDEAHIRRLTRSRVSVAYCPRASAYFGHPHPGQPPHRYREMLRAGINVSLGTDSIVCLDRSDRLSVFDEMCFLRDRDRTDCRLLLEMATVNGARALGFDESLFTFRPGPSAGILAIQGRRMDRSPTVTLDTAFDSKATIDWLVGLDVKSSPKQD